MKSLQKIEGKANTMVSGNYTSTVGVQTLIINLNSKHDLPELKELLCELNLVITKEDTYCSFVEPENTEPTVEQWKKILSKE